MKISWVHSWGVYIAKGKGAREKRANLPREAPHSMRLLGHEDRRNRGLVGTEPRIQSQRHSAGRGVSQKKQRNSCIFTIMFVKEVGSDRK